MVVNIFVNILNRYTHTLDSVPISSTIKILGTGWGYYRNVTSFIWVFTAAITVNKVI